MTTANAWLMDLGEGLVAAIGELELVHLLPDAPTLFSVPQSPAYCREVLVWQGAVLPLMDLAARILGRPATDSQGLVAITVYREHPEAEPLYGALALSRPPIRIAVEDSSACRLPESQSGWRSLAISCFEREGRGPVPILDLARVFAPLADRGLGRTHGPVRSSEARRSAAG